MLLYVMLCDDTMILLLLCIHVYAEMRYIHMKERNVMYNGWMGKGGGRRRYIHCGEGHEEGEGE